MVSCRRRVRALPRASSTKGDAMIDRGCKLVTAALAAVASDRACQRWRSRSRTRVSRALDAVRRWLRRYRPLCRPAVMAAPPGPEQLQQLMRERRAVSVCRPAQSGTTAGGRRRSTTARRSAGAANFASAPLGTATSRTASSRCRSTCSPRRTSTRTASSGAIRATSAATARKVSKRRAGPSWRRRSATTRRGRRPGDTATAITRARPS